MFAARRHPHRARGSGPDAMCLGRRPQDAGGRLDLDPGERVPLELRAGREPHRVVQQCELVLHEAIVGAGAARHWREPAVERRLDRVTHLSEPTAPDEIVPPADIEVLVEFEVGRIDRFVFVVALAVVLAVPVVEEPDIELGTAALLAIPPRQQKAGFRLVVLLNHRLEGRRERGDLVVDLAEVAERPPAGHRDQIGTGRRPVDTAALAKAVPPAIWRGTRCILQAGAGEVLREHAVLGLGAGDPPYRAATEPFSKAPT